MRLGQLARKLAIRTSEIVEFLGTLNITIETGSNTRIDDQHVLLVVEKFAPAMRNEILKVEDAVEVAEIEQAPVVETQAVSAIEESEMKTDSPVAEQIEAPVADQPGEKPEVIKAPKIELSGLKVLGKIELPEPKKKEPKPEDGETPAPESTESPVPARERRKPLRRSEENRPQRNQRSGKNPIALQREREEAEAKRKREEELKRLKEKKTQHYYSKVKVNTAVRKAKREEDHEEINDTTPERPAPTTLWGKFMRWLTT